MEATVRNFFMGPFRYVAITVLSIAPLLAHAEKLVVQAPNYPLFYFAERIASDSFEIRYRVDPEVDPAFWEPGDKDILAYQQADIILRNGAKYSSRLLYATCRIPPEKDFEVAVMYHAGHAIRRRAGEGR